MIYIKNIWKDQEVERPKTYELQDNPDGSTTLIDSFGVVTEIGTPVNADNMNHIEEGIAKVTDMINRQVSTFISVDDLRKNAFEKDSICITKGYYEVNDGGGASYIIREKTLEDVEDNGSIIFLQNNLVAEYIMIDSIINVKQFGLKLDGVTDDSIRFNAVVNFAKKITQKYDSVTFSTPTVLIPQGIMKIKQGINVNISYMNLIGVGAIIEASEVTGVAINVIADNPVPYQNAKSKIEGISLTGNKVAGNIGIALGYELSTNNQVSHISIEKCVIRNFDVGLYYGNHTYLIKTVSTDVYNCNTCIRIVKASDSGENMQFDNCALFNSQLAIENANNTSSVFFNGCSIDYNMQALKTMFGTTTFLNNCHIEWNNSKSSHFTEDGDLTFVRFSKCWFGHNTDESYPEDVAPYLITNSNRNIQGGVSFVDCYFNRLKASYFIKGGFFKIINSDKGRFQPLPLFQSYEQKMTREITFAPDNLYIGTLTIYNFENKTIKLEKKYGGGSAFDFSRSFKIPYKNNILRPYISFIAQSKIEGRAPELRAILLVSKFTAKNKDGGFQVVKGIGDLSITVQEWNTSFDTQQPIFKYIDINSAPYDFNANTCYPEIYLTFAVNGFDLPQHAKMDITQLGFISW